MMNPENFPDKTLDELREEGHPDVKAFEQIQQEKELFETALAELNTMLQLVEQAVDGEITVREYVERIDMLGDDNGHLALDRI